MDKRSVEHHQKMVQVPITLEICGNLFTEQLSGEIVGIDKSKRTLIASSGQRIGFTQNSV